MSDKIICLNENNFEKNVLQADKPFLVDFWAEWCGPCKIIEPFVIEIADKFDDKLTVGKINIDNNPIIVSKYSIRSVPTLLLFKHSKIVATNIGLLSKKQLKEFIDSNL